MPMLGAVILPHPPVILPEVGRGREAGIQATADACRAAARRVAAWNPEALVLCTPHVVMYADYFHLSPGERAAGSMARFGARGVRLSVNYDGELRHGMIREAGRAGIAAGTMGERDRELDHGALLPLYFLREAGVDCPVVRVGLSGFPPLEHYRLGQCAARAADGLGRRVAFVASGDLSHKLTQDGPYGYAPQGPEFDGRVTRAMGEGDFLGLLTLEPALSEGAAECGLRSFQMMAGALDGLAVQPELLSYEGPFGVGYGVAVFTTTGRDEGRCFGPAYEALERRRLAGRRAAEDAWTRLARLSLETYVRTGQRLESPPGGLPEELTQGRAGVFVSLHLRGQLRGCMGTIGPVTPSVAQEIMRNAVLAGTEDPRFPALTAQELDGLEYGVDVLGPTEPIESPGALDVKRYGVIVSRGGRRGLLLPNLDGVDRVEQQISIALQKGGISPDEPYELERFEVVRHH